MFSWIFDHAEAALTFFGAILLNSFIVALVFGRYNKRLEDVEGNQDQFVRKDVLQPQLDNIRADLSEVKADIKTLLGLPRAR